MARVNTMGVMNITPNSFSDGGKFNEISSLSGRYKDLLNRENFIFDFGGESTAPFNKAIDCETEKERLSLSFDLFRENIPSQRISLDSYRCETAFWYFNELEKLGLPSDQFIWNDISGVWDSSVEAFLRRFRGSTYIYCHNLSPERSSSSRHMDFTAEGSDVVSSVINHFKAIKSDPRVWFDPCFGFSKTYEQNWDLFERFGEVLNAFSVQKKHWVIGVSKKKFLRRYLVEQLGEGTCKEAIFTKSESLHLEMIKSFIERSRVFNSLGILTFRVHDPDIIDIATKMH